MSRLRGAGKWVLAAGWLTGCTHWSARSDSYLRPRAAHLIDNHRHNNSNRGSVSVPTGGHKWVDNWDKREPFTDNDNDDRARPVATRHIILVRHGQYHESGPEYTLTALGRSQAQAVGARLKNLDLPYKSIVHSTMTRAVETAATISQHLPTVPIESCADIEEGAPIPPEPPFPDWQPSDREFAEDGPRIEAAFQKHIHRADPTQTVDSYEIMVCHGNVIRYFLCRALQLPPDGYLRFDVRHCSVTWLAVHPNGHVTACMVGDVGLGHKP
ncbi:unnamed protein product [Medioppia subpectinata]|uniref:Serine/threonine-protein phosphatase PGAM5, mitochondrial n=1 Tax=Medioppia subpectinata TaxID=1979941 RepID=A0A7R9LDX0_9ACAR|nr:unnamed protein product [Medioppia subpectinata]CAG2117999.1 unnamed protein product [Medioppia subpectinata]